MSLSVLDYAIIGSFFILTTLIGFMASRRAGKSFTEYFLAGGKMRWWMLGLSMVATTFAADTPNLVTGDRSTGWRFRQLGLVGISIDRLSLIHI